MTLRKFENGFWYIYYTNPQGKRNKKSTGCRKKSDAVNYMEQWIMLSRGQVPVEAPREPIMVIPSMKADIMPIVPVIPVKPTVQSMLLSDFLDEVIKNGSNNLNATSLKSRKSWCNKFLKEFDNVPIDSLTVKDLQQWMHSFDSVYTQRHCHIAISAIFGVGVKWDYIEDNPFSRIQQPKIAEKRMVFYTKENIDDILDYFESMPDFRDFILVAINTGMRLAELCHLEWSDIEDNEDGEYAVIHVQNKEDFTTKSMKNRVIPINSTLRDVLERLPVLDDLVGSSDFPMASDRACRMRTGWRCDSYQSSGTHEHRI